MVSVGLFHISVISDQVLSSTETGLLWNRPLPIYWGSLGTVVGNDDPFYPHCPSPPLPLETKD